MKTTITRLLTLALAMPALAIAAERYELDPTHTYPNFTVDHLGFSVMHGRFNETSGHFVLDRKGGKSEVFVVVQTDSIDTGMDKRDDHLRNADFFDTSKHPTMIYKSSQVRFTSETSAVVDGELTLLGKTRPLTLKADNMRCGRHPFKQVYVCGFDVTGSLKRSDFGMDYGLGAIGDEIALRIEVEGVREEKRGGPR